METGALKKKNWPRCYPILHHDIPGEVPEGSRRVVREGYLAWYVSRGAGREGGRVCVCVGGGGWGGGGRGRGWMQGWHVCACCCGMLHGRRQAGAYSPCACSCPCRCCRCGHAVRSAASQQPTRTRAGRRGWFGWLVHWTTASAVNLMPQQQPRSCAPHARTVDPAACCTTGNVSTAVATPPSKQATSARAWQWQHQAAGGGGGGRGQRGTHSRCCVRP